MSKTDTEELKGISVKNTSSGFIIELQGSLYKRIGENVTNGKFTKNFYHDLKEFIQSIKKLEE